MKELVAKNKKGGANVFDKNATNNKIDKDKGAKAVDLDDVKISNILRESGTAGVSSILTAEPASQAEEPKTPQVCIESTTTCFFGPLFLVVCYI